MKTSLTPNPKSRQGLGTLDVEDFESREGTQGGKLLESKQQEGELDQVTAPDDEDRTQP